MADPATPVNDTQVADIIIKVTDSVQSMPTDKLILIGLIVVAAAWIASVTILKLRGVDQKIPLQAFYHVIEEASAVNGQINQRLDEIARIVDGLRESTDALARAIESKIDAQTEDKPPKRRGRPSLEAAN